MENVLKHSRSNLKGIFTYTTGFIPWSTFQRAFRRDCRDFDRFANFILRALSIALLQSSVSQKTFLGTFGYLIWLSNNHTMKVMLLLSWPYQVDFTGKSFITSYVYMSVCKYPSLCIWSISISMVYVVHFFISTTIPRHYCHHLVTCICCYHFLRRSCVSNMTETYIFKSPSIT